ncbi:uncharacterized protein F5Z01DRAFT_622029 [Emericellopsis atlantica]|uniref:C2H2-type domain-containing protein n=1 Tax=Emericellopsis atlantica TaxID=2614577 RepID=A0A9P7ZMK2_9HYPO|nr:uncharacterized protein F5Z01DRAFT_622029 [Emericellopsis atlantica]KAG9254467.1 hypothetical protein F5Z01DRAFT_622029 [Emericellopsis atlantica]
MSPGASSSSLQQQQQQNHHQHNQRPQSSTSGSIHSNGAPSHEDQLDRQMLRHLMRKYGGAEGLSRLMLEENGPPLDSASEITTSTFSSVESAPTSLFDSGSSIRSEETGSGRGSIISNVSARTAKFLSRSSEDVHASASPSAAAKQRGTFTCGFCSEEGVVKTCTRKNDLKRHIEDFHYTNAQWQCRQRSCGQMFDWATVYKTHIKVVHGGSRSTNLDDARIELCPQQVFACGFENCIQVYETTRDGEEALAFKNYVAHVIKHLDEGSNSGDWSYSTRIRNLMRQSGTLRAWTESDWPESERNKLVWTPQTSVVLRKQLETKHLGDLRMLVQYAIALGSDPESVPAISNGLPIREECRLHGGERIRIQGAQRAPSQPYPQQQQLMRQGSATGDDPFQFRISRGGTTNNPQLAEYYATQRRMQQFTTRPPVRSGRSARPPVRTIPAQQQQQQQQQQQALQQDMFDPTGYYHGQPSFAAASGEGGIVADDIRSLRSLASSHSGGDVDMGDGPSMEGGYGLPDQRAFYGLQAGPGEVKMEPPFAYQQGYQ